MNEEIREVGGALVSDIDLKWSLWTEEEGLWLDYAPETLALMKAEFTKGPPGGRLIIYTGPRKEIRYGEVIIQPLGGGLVDADVRFYTEWDEVPGLAEMLGLREDEEDALYNDLMEAGLTHEGGIGVTEVATIERIPSLRRLLVAVDEVEDTLLTSDQEAWKQLEALYRK